MNVTRLVTHPVETYVRQNETKIRSEAGCYSMKKDLGIQVHLDAILAAEDLAEAMATIAETLERRNKPGDSQKSATYRHHQAMAEQLKYYHLSQLANLIL